MKKLVQTEQDDCLSTCIAMILDLNHGDIPNLLDPIERQRRGFDVSLPDGRQQILDYQKYLYNWHNILLKEYIICTKDANLHTILSIVANVSAHALFIVGTQDPSSDHCLVLSPDGKLYDPDKKGRNIVGWDNIANEQMKPRNWLTDNPHWHILYLFNSVNGKLIK